MKSETPLWPVLEQMMHSWLQKASDDLAIAEDAMKTGNFKAACFLAREAAMKYLKAFLVHHGDPLPFPFPADLAEIILSADLDPIKLARVFASAELAQLVDQCTDFDRSLRSLRTIVDPLTPYRMKRGYDKAFWATSQEAEAVHRAAVAVKELVLSRLPKESAEKAS